MRKNMLLCAAAGVVAWSKGTPGPGAGTSLLQFYKFGF